MVNILFGNLVVSLLYRGKKKASSKLMGLILGQKMEPKVETFICVDRVRGELIPKSIN